MCNAKIIRLALVIFMQVAMENKCAAVASRDNRILLSLTRQWRSARLQPLHIGLSQSACLGYHSTTGSFGHSGRHV